MSTETLTKSESKSAREENFRKNIPPVRVRNQQLSLWQSVVAEHVLKEEKAKLDSKDAAKLKIANVQEHPMIIATNTFVEQAAAKVINEGHILGSEQVLSKETASDLAQLSEIYFHLALAKIYDDIELEERSTKEARKYSDHDKLFLTCVPTYEYYSKKYDGKLKYNSWKNEGKGNLNYGVIDYKLPNDAKVGIIGDWGTGMDDAMNLFKVMMQENKLDAIIHLGDIYYSGTPDEVYANFADVITNVFDEVLGKGNRIPVFNIPGNHDYYAFGYGLYDMVTGLNSFNSDAVQEASYFCLRTEDDGWQFLGMDTGYNDASPNDQVNPNYDGPGLQDTEIKWHKDKLDNFKGGTILLSHHQLYSSHAKINGMESTYSAYPNMNKYLLDIFQPYFGDKVAAWLWGHEHNQVLFQNGLYGLDKGRLIGASAFEEMTSEAPYKVNYPNVPIQSTYELKADHGYFNHGFAIIDLSGRKLPTDKVKISYYEYPSWGAKPPRTIPTTASEMTLEHIALRRTSPGKTINYGESVHFCLENGNDFVGKSNKELFIHYPSIQTQPVEMMITGGSGAIQDGDIVKIESLESNLKKSNIFSVRSTPAIYYNSSGSHDQTWVVRKAIKSTDKTIHENDPVHFVNVYYKQFLCPLIETAFDGLSLTTDANVPAKWFIKAKRNYKRDFEQIEQEVDVEQSYDSKTGILTISWQALAGTSYNVKVEDEDNNDIEVGFAGPIQEQNTGKVSYPFNIKEFTNVSPDGGSLISSVCIVNPKKKDELHNYYVKASSPNNYMGQASIEGLQYSDDTLTGSWQLNTSTGMESNPSEAGATGYYYEILDSNNKEVARGKNDSQDAASGNICINNLDKLTSGETYQLKISAMGGNGTIPGEVSEPQGFTIKEAYEFPPVSSNINNAPSGSIGYFLIGDEEAIVGNSVTFWGSNWVDKNKLSGGAIESSLSSFCGYVFANERMLGGTSQGAYDPQINSGVAIQVGNIYSMPAISSFTNGTDTGLSDHFIATQGKVTKIVNVQVDFFQDDRSKPNEGTGTIVSIVWEEES